MPVELRKRKAPAPAPAPKPPAKKRSQGGVAPRTVKAAVKSAAAKIADTNGSTKPTKPVVGDLISLDGFGGEVETNDGTKTSLKALVEESKAGVVLFTYPKASTPGCKSRTVSIANVVVL